MQKIDKILVGTHNKGKFIEISDLLPKKVEKISPINLDIESPVENGKTFEENSEIKANFFCEKSNLVTLSDDSGLEVDVLDGRPGIYSARYAKTNDEKIKKLINELSDSPYRSARFISCMVLCDPSGNLVKDTTGICWGEILKNPKYPNGEFESIFWVKESNCAVSYTHLTLPTNSSV